MLIFVYLSMHEWGAEYKYSDVPLGEWMKPWPGHHARNHYDRIMHFSYGLLLAYPMPEWFMRVVGVTSRWRYLLPVEMTLSFSACYEMLEALAASVLTPERGVKSSWECRATSGIRRKTCSRPAWALSRR